MATQDVYETNLNEDNVFKSLLLPDDSYNNGIYWADMSLGERIKFVRRVDSAEGRRELSAIKRVFQVGREGWNGPLARIGWIRGFSKLFAWYCKSAVLPGAGLGLEG